MRPKPWMLLAALAFASAPAAARLPNLAASELPLRASEIPVGTQARLRGLVVSPTDRKARLE